MKSLAINGPGNGTSRDTFWLSKLIVSGFLLFFVSCAIGLVLFDRYVSSKNGLEFRWRDNTFITSYAPTALLAIVLSLWRRLSNLYQWNQPWWQLLSGKPTPASDGILLDYVSPFFGIAFLKAIRLRHFAVAVSILGLILLKVVIVASTSLFTLGPSTFQRNVDIQYTSTFTTPGQVPSDKSLWSYLAHINSNDTKDMKDGRYTEIAYQGYQLATSPLNVTSVIIPVDAFIPQVFCEPAELSWDGVRAWAFKTPDCFVNELTSNERVMNSTNRSLVGVKVLSRIFRAVNCSSGSYKDSRYAISLSEHTNSEQRHRPLDNWTAAICKIDYTIVSVNVNHSLITNHVEFPPNIPTDNIAHIPNFTNVDLGSMLNANIAKASDNLRIDRETPESLYDVPSFGSYAFFQLVHSQAGRPRQNLAHLTSPQFARYCTTVLEGISREFAKSSLLVAYNRSIKAN